MWYQDELPPDVRVRLLVDVPESEVFRGDCGVVCSKWHMSADVYEVEFFRDETGETRRALLGVEQFEPEPEGVSSSAADELRDEPDHRVAEADATELQPA